MEPRNNGANMSPTQYAAARRQRGTQKQVAALLDVDVMTISRRERGLLPINRETELAINALPVSDWSKKMNMLEKLKGDIK